MNLQGLISPQVFLFLMWPCFFAIILAGGTSATDYSYQLLLFFLGSVAMRGAGCVVNDIADREIDAKVERTKNRPLASGRLTLQDAYITLFVLLSLGLIVFLSLNFNAKVYSIISLVLVLFYPYSKRFFDYPQFILGLTFNFGVFVAWVNITGNLTFSSLCLYVACVLWTVGYDTIYGYQDIRDDKMIGVKSTAITFGDKSRMVIAGCFVLNYLLISLAGYLVNLPGVIIFCLPAVFHMLNITKNINLDDPKDCMDKFKDIAYMSGLLIFVGLLLSKIIR